MEEFIHLLTRVADALELQNTIMQAWIKEQSAWRAKDIARQEAWRGEDIAREEHLLKKQFEFIATQNAMQRLVMHPQPIPLRSDRLKRVPFEEDREEEDEP